MQGVSDPLDRGVLGVTRKDGATLSQPHPPRSHAPSLVWGFATTRHQTLYFVITDPPRSPPSRVVLRHLLAIRLNTMSLLAPKPAHHSYASPLLCTLSHYSPTPEARHHSLCFATTLYDTPFTRRPPLFLPPNPRTTTLAPQGKPLFPPHAHAYPYHNLRPFVQARLNFLPLFDVTENEEHA